MNNETTQACVEAIRRRIEFINSTYSKESPRSANAGLVGIGRAIDALARRYIRPIDWQGHNVSDIVRVTWVFEWYFNYCQATAEVCRAAQSAVRDKRLTLRSSLTRTALDEKSLDSWLCRDINALQVESFKRFFPGVLDLSLINDVWPDAVGKPSGAAYAQDIANWADADGLATVDEAMKLLTCDGNPIVPKTQDAPGEPLPVLPAAVPILQPQDGPKGITKEQVLMAFEEMVKPFKLAGALKNGKGLFGSDEARTQRGTRGATHAALWNPVILAIGMNEKYLVPMPHLKRAFNEHPFLRVWADEWRDKLDLLGE